MIHYTTTSSIPRQQLETFFKQNWGDTVMAIKGQLIPLLEQDGFVAYLHNQMVGLISYQISAKSCDIISLDSLIENQGIGSQLLTLVEKMALSQHLTEIRLVTTNDNLKALAFYQKRGYYLDQLYPNAATQARQLKPSIPLIAANGILIRDELELRKELFHDNNT